MKNIRIEGNNGGDYIEITQSIQDEKEGMIDLNLGQCCVHQHSLKIPVMYLVEIINRELNVKAGLNIQIRVAETLSEAGFKSAFVSSLATKSKELNHYLF